MELFIHWEDWGSLCVLSHSSGVPLLLAFTISSQIAAEIWSSLLEIVRCCSECWQDNFIVRIFLETPFGFGRVLWLSGNRPGCGNALEFWIRAPVVKSLRKVGKL